MRLNPDLKPLDRLALFITALLMLTFLEACNRFDKDDANRQAQTKKGPAPISVENGQTVFTLDTSTQNHLGLEVATLTATALTAQFTVPAVILSVEDLALFAMAMLRHRRSFKNHASKQTLPVRSTRA